MNLRVILGSLALLTAVIGVGAGLAYYKYRAIKAGQAKGPPPEMPESVSIASVQTVEARLATSSIGTVVAPHWITLKNEIAGRIESFPLRSGQIVEKGAILLVLEKSVELAQLQSAQARQKIAESMLKRTRLAATSNAVTELEVEQAEAETAQAKADVARLQAIIEKKSLRAPFRARAGLINLHEGQYISDGTEITMLQGLDNSMYVDFMVPQQVADYVSVGDQVVLLVASSEFSAPIIARDTRADRATRNLMLRAELLNPPERLVPNDSVTVAIRYGPAAPVGAVPPAAVRRSPEGAFVYVAEPDRSGHLRAHRRPVQPGANHGNLVMILSGLAVDERVITDGSFKLRDGALVTDQVELPEAPRGKTKS